MLELLIAQLARHDVLCAQKFILSMVVEGVLFAKTTAGCLVSHRTFLILSIDCLPCLDVCSLATVVL
jgi:hypothetical protein